MTRIGIPEGRTKRYVSVGSNIVVFTWQAALADNTQLFISNVLGDSVAVYSLDGKRLRAFPLHSPTMQRLAVRNEADSPDQMAAILLRMKRQRYTTVRRLSAVGRYLFVQLERVNARPGEPQFLLDVYDVQGCLRFAGVPTPGHLIARGGNLYFVKRADTGHGALWIRPARLKISPSRPCVRT